MPWSDFIGNSAVTAQLRRLASEGRAQRTVVLAGPEGVGKTTLALMLGLSLNCRQPPQPGDFCGQCGSCAQAAALGAVDRLTAEALEYRGAEVKTNPRETAPLQIVAHPAVRLYPPDGDFLTMAQARALIRLSQMTPDSGGTWTLVIPEFDRARWNTQAALLKTLEEPPPGVVILALARNPLALLPTVRSRALMLALAPMPVEALAAALVARGEAPPNAELRARLAAGAPGRALALDLEAYQAARHEALALVRAGLAREAAVVFRISESTRTGKEKFESLLEILYSVFQDIVHLQSGFSGAIRNADCISELTQLAQRLSPSGLPRMIGELDSIQAAAGRNAFRPLALDSWALGLSPS